MTNQEILEKMKNDWIQIIRQMILILKKMEYLLDINTLSVFKGEKAEDL